MWLLKPQTAILIPPFEVRTTTHSCVCVAIPASCVCVAICTTYTHRIISLYLSLSYLWQVEKRDEDSSRMQLKEEVSV